MNAETVSYNKTEEILTFKIKDVPESFLNCIRRISMDEVPTLAIEDVKIKENDSALYDQILAHRLGLIPIKTDLNSYKFKRGEEDDGNPACELTFTLKSSKKGLVLAEELTSNDPKCKPVHPTTPIVKLRQKQKVELEAVAVLGKGKEHAKWSPGIIFFKKQPSFEINQNKIKDNSLIIDSCPLGIFEEKAGKVSPVKDKMDACHRCENCVDLSRGAVKLVTDTNDFIVTTESFGQHKAPKILELASDTLAEKLEEFKTLLKE